MIVAGIQKKSSFDNDSSVVAQVSFMRQTANVNFITPYGYYAMPPANSAWLIFPLRDNDDDLVGIGNDYVNRPKDLVESDICLFNTKSKAKFIFKASGDVEMYCPKNLNILAEEDINIEAVENINFTAKNINSNISEMITITTPDVVINGDITQNGNLTTIGTITGNLIKSIGDLFWNAVKSVMNHTHAGGSVPPPD